MSLLVSTAAALALLALITLCGQAWLARVHRPSGAFVSVDGGRLHVAETGRAQREGDAPVVLVHGASGNLEDMRVALADTLSARWRVLMVDRPGHGWSDRIGGADAASPARQAAAIHEALSRVDAKKPVLVAHSWSGALATAFALRHPGDVSGLVLIAPATHPWEGGVSWYYSLATAPLLGGLFAWTQAFPAGSILVPNAAAAVFAPQSPPPDYLRRAAIRLVLRPASFIANARDVAALKHNLRAQSLRYGEIAVPVTIISGDRDATVSLDIHSRALAAAIPHARLQILEGVGHMPHHARPDLVAAAVQDMQDEIRSRVRPDR